MKCNYCTKKISFKKNKNTKYYHLRSISQYGKTFCSINCHKKYIQSLTLKEFFEILRSQANNLFYLINCDYYK